jgi:hypothetical protein
MVGAVVGLTCRRPCQTKYYSSRSNRLCGNAYPPMTMRNKVIVHSTGAEEGTGGKTETELQNEVCKTCGVPRSEMAFGCDGTGRIMGGIGAVPGFGWWPIKAYRPCGKAADAGVTYQRKGQGVDEVMFGRK